MVELFVLALWFLVLYFGLECYLLGFDWLILVRFVFGLGSGLYVWFDAGCLDWWVLLFIVIVCL